MKVFRLYWLDRTIEIVYGLNIVEACNKAGIGGGAIGALDWYEDITHQSALQTVNAETRKLLQEETRP